MKILYAIPSVLFFLLVPQFVDGIEFPRLITLFVILLIFVVLKPRILVSRDKLFYLPFVLPFIMFLSTLFNQENLLIGLFGKQGRNFGILLYLSMAILFVAISNYRVKNSSNFFTYGLLPITFFSIIYGFIQITGNDPFRWGESDRVVLSVGNSNFAAGYLATLIPVGIYGAIRQKNFAAKFIYFPMTLLIIFLGIKTISAQFYVLAFISIVSFMFVYKFDVIASVPTKTKWLISIFAITITSLVLFVNRNLIDEFTNAADRLAQQRSGLNIFKDHILFGVGPDGLNRFMPKYLLISDVRREGYYNNPDRTHNTLVDFLANIGVFGGLAYLSFILFVFFMIRKIIVSNEITKIEVALPVSIFVTYFVQGFINTDSVLNMVVPYIAMGVIGSFYTHQEGSEKAFLKSENYLVKSIAGICLLSLFFVAPRVINSEIEIKRILSANQLNEEEILDAVNAWPDRGNIERVLVALAQQLSNCPVTVKVADRLIEVDTRSAQGWYVKALCVDATGDLKTAKEFVTKALEFQPLNPTYLRAMVLLDTALGLENEARKSDNTLKSLNLVEPNS